MAGIISFFIVLCLTAELLAVPVVQTSQGSVSGTKTRTRKGREFLAYYGIPYAEPPIGKLRFRSPIRKKPWHGILKANQTGPPCLQEQDNNIIGSEDCLFLNVYTPQVHLSGKHLLPVMVYIHGGGYMAGEGGPDLYGPEYLLDKDIVLVTMNYRLGIFGFLSTGDLEAPGNFGMKDQLLVLKWIQENIREFGGNPHEVTLFGESAGSASVHLHTLSSPSKHLFNQYILQSGTALCPWAFRTRSSYYEYAKKAADLLNCTKTNSFMMVNCLRNRSARELVNTSSIFDYISGVVSSRWGPTIEPAFDGAFLTDSPIRIMLRNRMKYSTIMTGIVQDEGLYVSANLYANQPKYELFYNYPERVLEELLSYYDPLNNRNLTELAVKMKRFYFGEQMPNDIYTVVRIYSDFVSDLFFFYPHVQFLQFIMERNYKSVYSYLFAYRGAVSITSRSSKNNINLGVTHSDELLYLFQENSTVLGLPTSVRGCGNDGKILNLMVDLWSSFAQTRAPESTCLHDHSVWKPYQWNKSYFIIGNNSNPTTALKHYVHTERLQFWLANVPTYFDQ